MVWTGALDQAFDCKFGPLPWRSIEFELVHQQSSELLFPVAVINEPSVEVPYTRTTEFRWLTGRAGIVDDVVPRAPRSVGARGGADSTRRRAQRARSS